ncbi:MAG: CRISPR-associated helicase Cas3' [Methanomassiliicoccales archaeon]
MSCYSELKSHPGKLLKDHLREVGNSCKQIVKSLRTKNNEPLSDFAYLMGISHDFGKGTTFFQDHLDKGIKTEKSYHSKLSSVFGYYICKKYSETNEVSLGYDIPIVVWLAIMKHHTDISDLVGNDGELEKLCESDVEKKQIEDIRSNTSEIVKDIYSELLDFEISLEEFFKNYDSLCNEIRDRWESIIIIEKKGWEYYFLTMFLYSVLLDADKLDASDISYSQLEEERKKWREITNEIVDNYKEMKFETGHPSAINEIRSKAYTEVISELDNVDLTGKKIFTIELPTGCGKTITAISAALKIRERIKKVYGFSPRIIYSLPFLSIIDQNANVLAEILANHVKDKSQEIATDDEDARSQEREKTSSKSVPTSLLMKHHHLSEIRYVGDREKFDVEQSLLLIEGWHSEVIVTTFVQLFHSLITNRNRSARKFHNMANSIIILDEVQAIPHRYWLLVKCALNYLAKRFNSWIILMTATMPLIFNPDEICPLVRNKTEYYKQFNRARYFFCKEKKDIEELAEIVLDDIINSDKNIGVILNTIDCCKELYNILKKRLTEKYGNPKICQKCGVAEFCGILLFNLSTHILPKHRKMRIELIRDEKEKRRKIVITTQLIEAGVDIDLDVIYRDFAPLDALIQSGGRCNRNNREKMGLVKIVQLIDKNGRQYSSFVYDPTLLSITREIIESEFEESRFLSLIEKYFEKISRRGSDDPSEKILSSVRYLEFSTIGTFELLEGNFRESIKIDSFVKIDDEARRIWDEYESIQKIKNGFERRSRFLQIRNRFYDYVISIDRACVQDRMVDENLAHITSAEYDLEIGFKPKKNYSFII